MVKHSDPPFNFQPVVIIGAARSGTNMLRDILTRLPGVATWPCDEINYIWRHGNRHLPHDEFDELEARGSVRRYVRSAFRSMARRSRCRYLIEKTCANSLRVEFVDTIIPEAKYILLVRDGRDVVASAMKRWTAALEPMYLMKKMRFVPPDDLVYYAARYLGHRVHRLFSPERRLKSWGPRTRDLETLLRSHPLDEVCGIQWARSVEAAERDFASRSEKVFCLRYEDFVASPAQPLERLLQFLGIETSTVEREQVLQGVFTGSAGGWQRHLTSEQIERLEHLLAPTLERLGYPLAASGARHAA